MFTFSIHKFQSSGNCCIENLFKLFTPCCRPCIHLNQTLEQEHPGLSKSEKRKICGLMDCRKLSVDARMHAVQNERLPLRVVVQVLFFEQIRAAGGGGGGGVPDLPSSVRSLLPRENCGSHGSSRSAATNTTEEDWVGVPTVEDLKSIKSMRLVGGGSGRSSTSSDIKSGGDDQSHGKVKGVLTPKKILSKIWSGRGAGGENSSSDTSESPGSTNLEESKSTPSRNVRHSVS